VLDERTSVVGVDACVARVGVAEQAAVGRGAGAGSESAGDNGDDIEMPAGQRGPHPRIIPSTSLERSGSMVGNAEPATSFWACSSSPARRVACQTVSVINRRRLLCLLS